MTKTSATPQRRKKGRRGVVASLVVQLGVYARALVDRCLDATDAGAPVDNRSRVSDAVTAARLVASNARARSAAHAMRLVRRFECALAAPADDRDARALAATFADEYRRRTAATRASATRWCVRPVDAQSIEHDALGSLFPSSSSSSSHSQTPNDRTSSSTS